MSQSDVLLAQSYPNLSTITQRLSCKQQGSPCTAVWKAGDLAVRCKTCQTSNTSAICIACFKAGVHEAEGHDYSIYSSGAGGACDCGDLTSFCAEGCCPHHRPIPAGQAPTTSASLDSLLNPAEQQTLQLCLHAGVMQLTLAVLKLIIQDQQSGAQEPRGSGLQVVLISRWLSGLVSLTAVRPLACSLVMRELELGGASGDAEVLAEVQPEPSSSPESFCSSQGNEHSWQLQSGLEVMQGELVGILAELEGDSQDQAPTKPSLLSVLLRHLAGLSGIHEEATAELTTFLLLLVYDPDCKYYTAVHIVACYHSMLNTICTSTKSHHPLTNALDRLTVQLFNSEDVTYRLVEEASLLQTILSMLKNVMEQEANIMHTTPPDDAGIGYQQEKSKVLWPVHRRCQGDLITIFHHPKVAAAFVQSSDCQSLFYEHIAHAQGVLQQKRRINGEMVPMGSFKVHFAFQIEFVLLMTLPEIQRVLAGHPQQIQLHLEAASFALRATHSWCTTGSTTSASLDTATGSPGARLLSTLTSFLGGASSSNTGDAAAKLPVREFWDRLKAGTLDASLHLPLHRTFAQACFALIDCEHSPESQTAAAATAAMQSMLALLQSRARPMGSSNMAPCVWQLVQHHVLLMQCFLIQARLRLWILNGDDVAMADALYTGCREQRDLDLLLLQICLAAGSPKITAFTDLLYALGAGPLLHAAGVCPAPPGSEPPAQQLSDKRRQLGCLSALRFLLILLRDRSSCSTPKERLRQLLLAHLAVRDSGYHQLVRVMPADLQQSHGHLIDEVLNEIAIYRQPSLAEGGKFILKIDAWRSFDPHSGQLSMVTKQRAMERAMQADYKPHWQLSQPTTSLPPSLEPMRAVLLLPGVYRVVRYILEQATSTAPIFTSEDLTLTALNLLALQLHYTKELIEQHTQQQSAASSASPATVTQATTLIAAALHGGAFQGHSFPPILPLLSKLSGSAAASSEPSRAGAAAQTSVGGEVDDVVDCCKYLVTLSQEVLNAGRSADLLQADIAVTPAAEGPVNEADKQAELKAKAKAKQAEAMAKLRAQQAAFLQQAEADEAEAEEEGEEGGDSQMEEGPSNAQPAVDESVQQAMETSEAGDEDEAPPEILQGSTTAPNQQQQHRPSQEPLQGSFSSWSGPPGSSADGECVVCRQAGTREAPLGWLGHFQASGALLRPLLGARAWNTQAEVNQGPGTTAGSCYATSCADRQPGFLMLCCGHQMHAHCFDNLRQRSLMLAASGVLSQSSLITSIRHKEIVCPVCRRLGNLLLPAADFRWQPPQEQRQQQQQYAGQAARADSAFGHLGAMVQQLVGQARLEAKLHVVYLEGALRKRATLVEHEGTASDAPVAQQFMQAGVEVEAQTSSKARETQVALSPHLWALLAHNLAHWECVRRPTPHGELEGGDGFGVVHAAHWRALRSLTALCLATINASTSSVSVSRRMSAANNASNTGGSTSQGNDNNSGTDTNAMSDSPSLLEQADQARQAQQGASEPSQAWPRLRSAVELAAALLWLFEPAAPPPAFNPAVDIASCLLPQYDVAFVEQALAQHRSDNRDPWTSSAGGPAAFQKMVVCKTWPQLVTDPFLCLLELLALASTGGVAAAVTAVAAQAGADAVSADSIPSTAQGLVSFLTSLLLPLCAMQSAVWTHLKVAASSSTSSPADPQQSSSLSLTQRCSAVVCNWLHAESSGNGITVKQAGEGAAAVADDAALLESIAVQLLPFLVRAYTLHCACSQSEAMPDQGLLHAYTELRQQMEQQQQGALALADQLSGQMGVQGSLADHLNHALTAVSSHTAGTELMRRWCGHLPLAFQQQVQSSAQQSMVQSHAAVASMPGFDLAALLPSPPMLISLPRVFQDLLLFFAGKVCTHCKQVPAHPCLDLVTGELVCSWNGCNKGPGGAKLLAIEACSGSTLMLSLKSTKVIALNGPRSIVVPKSVYLDSHGDEDTDLRRGRPLFLQHKLYAHLAQMWSMQTDFDSVLLHASRSDLEIL